MAYSVTTVFTDNDFLIKVARTDGTSTAYYSINKEEVGDISTAGNIVALTIANEKRPIYKFDYRDVTTPVVASTVDLYNALTSYINSRPDIGIYAKWDTFTNADLVDSDADAIVDALEITHNWNTTHITITVYDNTGATVAVVTHIGDISSADTANMATILCGGVIAGTWSYYMSGHQ